MAKRTIKTNTAKPAATPATATVSVKPNSPTTAQAASSVTVKPGDVAVLPVTATAVKPPKAEKPAKVAVAKPSTLERFAFRDAAYLASARYPTGNVSADDSAYITLFAAFTKAGKGVGNIAEIDNSGRKPPGVTVRNNRARLHRLVGAGICEYTTADKLNFSFSAKALTLAAYTTATSN